MTRQLNLRLLLFYGPILCFLEITCDPSLPVNPSEISEDPPFAAGNVC